MDKNEIIFYNNEPISIEIFEWFEDQKNKILKTSFENDEVKIFAHFMPEDKHYLHELNCNEIFQLLIRITHLGDGMTSGNGINFDVTLSQLEFEIDTIRKYVVFWCLLKDIPINEFGKLYKGLYDDCHCNMKFLYKV